MMEWLMAEGLIFPIALAAGLLTKWVDLVDEHGLRAPRFANWGGGAVYGALLAFAISHWAVAATLGIAVVVGLFIGGTIDSPGHWAGMAALLAGLGVWGIPQLNPVHFGIFIVACVVEEMINTRWLDRGKLGHGVMARFLSLRPVLEIVAFGVALASGLWLIWLTLLAFDIGYVTMTKVGERRMARSPSMHERAGPPTGFRIWRLRR
jgi:hypothetical protein